jgi:hypothetical protein
MHSNNVGRIRRRWTNELTRDKHGADAAGWRRPVCDKRIELTQAWRSRARRGTDEVGAAEAKVRINRHLEKYR